MDVSTFFLYYQFEIFCRSWFKFLIGNFTVVLIRDFSWLRTLIFKATWSTQIFFGKLMKLMQKWKRYNNKVSSRKELFQLSQNSVRKEKTNYFTGRHPAGFSGNRLRKNKHKKKFIRHINSRNPMVRWIWDFVVRQVTPNHKPPVYHVW